MCEEYTQSINLSTPTTSVKMTIPAEQAGFSLIEMLVAFTILAFALGVLLRIFSSGIGTAVTAEEYTVAVQIAESLMAKAGVENTLLEGELKGIEDQKYNWLISTSLFQTEFENQLSEDADDQPEKQSVYQITVTVNWGGTENFEAREIELKTLKFASSPDT